MNDTHTLDLFAEPPPKPVRSSNAAHLARVSGRIGTAIVDYCRDRVGQEFHAHDLRAHVMRVVGMTAPASADRVLRELRLDNIVSYEVVNRRRSLYRCLSVKG